MPSTQALRDQSAQHHRVGRTGEYRSLTSWCESFLCASVAIDEAPLREKNMHHYSICRPPQLIRDLSQLLFASPEMKRSMSILPPIQDRCSLTISTSMTKPLGSPPCWGLTWHHTLPSRRHAVTLLGQPQNHLAVLMTKAVAPRPSALCSSATSCQLVGCSALAV